MPGSLDALLIYPPITDPTSPYHSLVYLASYARAQGFPRIEIRDTNVEALHYCARPEVLGAMMREWEERRRRLGAKPYLSRLEQLEYRYLVRAESLEPESPSQAIHALRNPETFYDYSSYREAVRQVLLWTESLSCDAFPGQFSAGGSSLAVERGLFSFSSVADLSDPLLLDRVVGPFRPYYHRELFPDISRQRPSVVGINVTYMSQLPYALWLVREIRRLLPETYLVCGGTEVSAVWKNLADRNWLGRLFRGADACVVGEGETAFVRILEAAKAGKPPGAIPNVVRLDRERGTIIPPPSFQYEDLNALPTPEFGLMRQDLYFSPHPLVYYSPTRGCYWNKCTFCDYGLNFGTPTSPWRQRNAEAVVRDLQITSAYTPYVYLSVDVLAPGYLLKLAQVVVDAQIDLRWSAEIRLEKYFNTERCQLLGRSGCVAVSVGFESGCQRILDLIQKGTRLDHIEATIRSFAEAKIAVQMMGFTGFPTETYEEALESVDYLLRNGSSWTVGGLGEFLLTPGAIIAMRPDEFGIWDLRPPIGEDICRSLTYRETAGPAKTPAEERAVEEAKNKLVRAEFTRPYAGGTDSAHSIFYYARYGRSFPGSFVPANPPSADWCRDDAVPALNGKLLPREPFDLLSLFDSEGLREIHQKAAAEHLSLDARLIRAELNREGGEAFPTGKRAYFLRRDGAILPCPSSTCRLLKYVDGRRTLTEILERVSSEELDEDEVHDLAAYTRMLSFVMDRTRAGGSAAPAAPLSPARGSRAETYRALAFALARQQVLLPQPCGDLFSRN
jgi:hypothetical protein